MNSPNEHDKIATALAAADASPWAEVGQPRFHESAVLHVLGDMPSSKIIGIISDHSNSNLGLGLGVTVIALVIASVIFIMGARYAPPLHVAVVEPAAV